RTPRVEIPEAIKLQETEEVTNEAVTTTLRRAITFFSTIQARDCHWLAESAGPLLFLPPMGLHIEGHSTMFGSIYSYITLRLLGDEADSCAEDMAAVKGRQWILDHGGAVGTPSWGKFWLTVHFL
nr:lupeol synthase [Tanacetum cinerariifolium]GFA71404.1 lupeol synthase [Tanacetum cinerariifolium]